MTDRYQSSGVANSPHAGNTTDLFFLPDDVVQGNSSNIITGIIYIEFM